MPIYWTTLDCRAFSTTALWGSQLFWASHQSIDDILTAVASFDDFNDETDSDNEHVFGKVDVNGAGMIRKIKYFAGDHLSTSPDKTDIQKTVRVFAAMLCEENLGAG